MEQLWAQVLAHLVCDKVSQQVMTTCVSYTMAAMALLSPNLPENLSVTHSTWRYTGKVILGFVV